MTTQYTASSAGNKMMAIGLQHNTYVTFSFFLAYEGKKYTFQTIKEKLWVTVCPKVYGVWGKQHFEAKDSVVTVVSWQRRFVSKPVHCCNEPPLRHKKDVLFSILYYLCCTQEVLAIWVYVSWYFQVCDCRSMSEWNLWEIEVGKINFHTSSLTKKLSMLFVKDSLSQTL